MRVNVNLPEEIVRRADERAKELFLSRSAYITMCISRKLDEDRVLDSLPDLKVAMAQLSANIETLNQK